MQNKKMILSLLAMTALVLSGCSQTDTTDQTSVEEKKLTIVTTFAPLYSHVKKIVGNQANVNNLVPVGVSVHVWQPTPQDIASLETADLVVANGLGLEEFIHEELEALEAKGKAVLEVGGSDDNSDTETQEEEETGIASDKNFGCENAGGVWNEEFHECEGVDSVACTQIGGHFNECASACRHDPKAEVCTMQCVLVCEFDSHNDSEEEKHAEEHYEDDGHNHGGVDPHVWLDPQQAIIHVQAIVEAVSTLDPEHAEIYRANAAEYIQELQETDEFIRASFDSMEKKPFIVFHDAYSYFLKAYGLETYQAGVIQDFEGDTPSVRELSDLLQTIKDKNVEILFTEPQFSPKIVETLKNEGSFVVMQLDPIGSSLTADGYMDNLMNIANTFMTAMQKN